MEKESYNAWVVIFILLVVAPIALVVGLVIRLLDLLSFFEIKTMKGGDTE